MLTVKFYSAWALVTCFLFCLGCVPYLIPGIKDTEHYCSHCGCMLATHKKSGSTIVQQHG